ncbi:hypothetical protein Tco_1556852 [Tanacetum coccineum]
METVRNHIIIKQYIYQDAHNKIIPSNPIDMLEREDCLEKERGLVVMQYANLEGDGLGSGKTVLELGAGIGCKFYAFQHCIMTMSIEKSDERAPRASSSHSCRGREIELTTEIRAAKWVLVKFHKLEKELKLLFSFSKANETQTYMLLSYGFIYSRRLEKICLMPNHFKTRNCGGKRVRVVETNTGSQSLGAESRDQSQFTDAAEMHNDTPLAKGIERTPFVHGVSQQQSSSDCNMFNNTYSPHFPDITGAKGQRSKTKQVLMQVGKRFAFGIADHRISRFRELEFTIGRAASGYTAFLQNGSVHIKMSYNCVVVLKLFLPPVV